MVGVSWSPSFRDRSVNALASAVTLICSMPDNGVNQGQRIRTLKTACIKDFWCCVASDGRDLRISKTSHLLSGKRLLNTSNLGASLIKRRRWQHCAVIKFYKVHPVKMWQNQSNSGENINFVFSAIIAILCLVENFVL